MSPLTISLTDFLTILVYSVSIAATAGYAMLAWNRTPFPVFFCKLIDWVRRRKDSDFEKMHTRNEWTAWSHLNFSPYVAHWLNCPICQTPYLVTALYLVTYLIGAITFTHAFFAWSISIAIAVKFAISGKEEAPAVPAKQKLPFPGANLPKNGQLAAPSRKGLNDDLNEMLETARTGKRPAGPGDEVEFTEVSAPVAPTAGLTRQEQLKRHASTVLKFQDAFGIQTERTPEGAYRAVPGSISDEFKTLLRFFIPSEPCWFEGCEELRERHAAELAALGGPDCPSCVESDLTRKYLLELKQQYPQSYGTPPPNSGN